MTSVGTSPSNSPRISPRTAEASATNSSHPRQQTSPKGDCGRQGHVAVPTGITDQAHAGLEASGRPPSSSGDRRCGNCLGSRNRPSRAAQVPILSRSWRPCPARPPALRPAQSALTAEPCPHQNRQPAPRYSISRKFRQFADNAPTALPAAVTHAGSTMPVGRGCCSWMRTTMRAPGRDQRTRGQHENGTPARNIVGLCIVCPSERFPHRSRSPGLAPVDRGSAIRGSGPTGGAAG